MGDFGFCIHARTEAPKTRLGTLEYLSPEMLKLLERPLPTAGSEAPQPGPDYGREVDVW